MTPVNPNRITIYLTEARREKWERLRAIMEEQQDRPLSLSGMLDKLVDEALARQQRQQAADAGEG